MNKNFEIINIEYGVEK